MTKKFSYKSLSVFVVLAVILLLIFFSYKGWLEIPKNIVFQIFNPILKPFQLSASQFGAGVKIITTIKNLISENNNLKKENQRLWQQNSGLKEAERENIILRQRLDLGSVNNHRFILASVVGFDPEVGQFFLIDKGEAEGVIVNSAVVTENNFLVGKIIEVRQHGAKVLPITDSNSSIMALTQDSRVSGIVKGTHGLGLEMDMIPIREQIKSGENVLSSGRENEIPAGLIVGKISETIIKEAEIFQKAVVQPAADFSKLESVFILTSEDDAPAGISSE